MLCCKRRNKEPDTRKPTIEIQDTNGNASNNQHYDTTIVPDNEMSSVKPKKEKKPSFWRTVYLTMKPEKPKDNLKPPLPPKDEKKDEGKFVI